jgi:hypothetical protein
LQVEALEDRSVPSTFTVLNLADSGEGSLRAAILDAEANTTAQVLWSHCLTTAGISRKERDFAPSE